MTTTLHPNPHQKWCDLSGCFIDTDGSTAHYSASTQQVFGPHHKLDVTLARHSDGEGTQAFIGLDDENPYTPDQLEEVAQALLDLAARIRETP